MLMGETKETVCIYLLSLSLSVHLFSSGLFVHHSLKTFCFLASGKMTLRVFIFSYFGFLRKCVDLWGYSKQANDHACKTRSVCEPYNHYKTQICSVQPLMILMKTRGNLLRSRVISAFHSRPEKGGSAPTAEEGGLLPVCSWT